MKFKNILFFIVLLSLGSWLLASLMTDAPKDSQGLAEKYAPNFHFSAREKYFPCNYEKYFFDQQGIEISAQQAKNNYLQQTLGEKLNNFEIFYNVDTSNPSETLIQYWAFYVFNEFINDHYGDAEVITIAVDNSTGQITKVMGSAHYGSYSKAFMANNQIRNLGHDHPMILVENGSHAMCPDKDGDGEIGSYELDNWYNAYGIYNWDSNDINHGIYVLYTDPNYHLSPISQLSQKKLTLAESLGLKINMLADLGFTKIEEKFYLPIGGWPADASLISERLKNPSSDFAIDWQWVAQNLANFNFLTAGKMPETPQDNSNERLGAAIDNKSATTSTLTTDLKADNQPIIEKRSETPKIKKSPAKPAESINLASPPPRILITAICPGIKESDQEAIEIANIDQAPTDLSKLNIFFINSKGEEQKKNLKTITKQNVIAPGERILLASSQAAALTGWPISDATFSSGLVQNGGLTIKDDKGNILDSVFWGESQPGINGLLPIIGGLKTGICLMRPALTNTNDNAQDFQLTSNLCLTNGSGVKICNFLPETKIIEIKKETTKTQETKKSSSDKSGATKIVIEAYPLIINEVMYNPTSSDTGREWIELYNRGEQKVDLTKLSLFEGNVNHKIYERFQTLYIEPKGYAILSTNPDKLLQDFPYLNNTPVFKCALSLNNDKESLILKNQDLALDYNFYASSSGANGNGYSLQLIDGQWHESWPTPNKENVLSLTTSLANIETPTASSATSTPINASSTNEAVATSAPPQIRINEIMYNPLGNDESREWVEIFNFGADDIDINGWKFFEGGVNHGLDFGGLDTILKTGSFAIISSNTSSFATEYPLSVMLIDSSLGLNNYGEPMILRDKNKHDIDMVIYEKNWGADGDGSSLQYFEETWIGAMPTPGQINIKPIPTTTNPEPTSTTSDNTTTSIILDPMPSKPTTTATSTDSTI